MRQEDIRIKNVRVIKLVYYFTLCTYFTAFAQNNSSFHNYKVLKCGYSKSLLQAFQMEDAKAAIEIFVQEIIKENSNSRKAQTFIFEKPEEVISEIKNDLDFAFLSYPEYWTIRKKTKLYPQILPVFRDSVQEKIFLLVRKTDPITDLSQLSEKKIVFGGNIPSDYSLAQIWFNSLIRKNVKKIPKKFMANSFKVSNGANAIMDLFFKKADAAVVIESDYRTMNELNPQISKQLQIFSESKPLIYAIGIYTDKLMNHPDLKIINKKILSLQNSSNGRNYLRIFKLSRLVPFNQSYENNSAELMEENDRFKK